MELKDIKKITGIITQGAKSLGNEMFVTAYSLEYSEDGKKWTKYTDDEDYEQKVSGLTFWDSNKFMHTSVEKPQCFVS